MMIDRALQPPATHSPSPSPSYLMHILWWWLFTPRQSERLQEKTVLVTLHYATVQFAWYVNNSFATKQLYYKILLVIQRKGLFHASHLSDIKWTCTLPARSSISMKVPISPHNTYDYATLATALQMNCVRKGRLSLMDMLLFIQYNALLLWVPHLCQPSKKQGMVRISITSWNIGENYRYFSVFPHHI